MITGDWITVVLDYDKTAEYSGQDIDTTSDLFDLGADLPKKLYDGFDMILPTIDTGTVGILVAQTDTITEVPIAMHVSNGVGSTVVWTVASGTGAIIVSCRNCPAFQYGRVKTGGNQTANRSFKIRGIRS